MGRNIKWKIEPIANEDVRLRLIENSDLITTLAWRNHDEARKWFKTSSELTFEQHQTWFNRYLSNDDDFLFVVEAEGKLIGQVSAYGIEWEKGVAEIGRFVVAPGYAGKGYASKALKALIQFCADSLDLKYLFLEVFEGNDRAIRLYKRHNFLEECRYNGLIRMGRKELSGVMK
jgi:diamine N-acetyltransferase